MGRKKYVAGGGNGGSCKSGNKDSALDENKSLKEKLVALVKEVQDQCNEITALRKENKDLRNKMMKNKTEVAGDVPDLSGKYDSGDDDDSVVVFGPKRPPTRPTQHRYEINTEISILTVDDVLSAGLSYCGFDVHRQRRVKLDTNINRFKRFFGAPPATIVPMFKDLRDNDPNIVYKDCLMACNWLYLYENLTVLSGRWGRNENDIGRLVIENGKKMQGLREKKIKYEFNIDGKFPNSLDGVNFIVQEFRQDPSAKWFDHKSHSCGLVSL